MAGLLAVSTLLARADEGMWLPSLIEQGRIKVMKKNGLKISAQDIYSVNQASLKDAIAQFDGGCTSEMISDEGLLLTNHHCGYDQIQAHSSVENDYLTNGFVAANRSEELPNKGVKVSFLQYMKDVTLEATQGVTATMSAVERDEKVAQNIKDIVAQATQGNDFRASVESMYYGNQYFLFVYEDFKDVRLVFAPASSIGKFGGDTDNWMWPRHTGDFTIFRVYADKDNKPADYSPDNVPYKPRKSLTISRKGIKEGDFTMVYGFPGRTSEYLHSNAVEYITEQTNPLRISMRTLRLDLMNAAAEQDRAVRIKYAAKNARISNGWKKWQGESKGLKRLGTVAKKRELEAKFKVWSADKPEYAGVVDRLGELYDSLQPWNMASDYYMEALYAVEALGFAQKFMALTPDTFNKERLQSFVKAHFKDYDASLDQSIARKTLVRFRDELDAAYLPEGVSVDELMANLKADSLFTNEAAMLNLLDNKSQEEVIATIKSNPIYVAMEKLTNQHSKVIRPMVVEYNARINEMYRPYMRGLMQMQPDRAFYPDANYTLRVASGKVKGYEPCDGVYYNPLSTLRGVTEKDNPEIYDYDVPQNLREIIKTKDYGQHEVNGTVPLAFIATNHTTGGNSGSPVLNNKGELIGLNFDRVWEGTMSDIEFDEDYCRNIALDIRYVLFVVDKVGGAGYLLDEMKFDKPFSKQ